MNSRFEIKRYESPPAYPRSGNAHNPTPNYYYVLFLDGRKVDQSRHLSVLQGAAREPNAIKSYSAAR